ncbi:MAG: helix-turn-helix domain-containing protein [bacterium]|nr:helix-turn-helix domain-containing protein [bacterium]
MDLADEVVEGYFLGSEKFINRIKKLSGQKTTFKRTIDEIIDKVCDNYNLEKKDVIGPGKKRSLSEARTMVAWIVRENKHLSLTDLSKIVKRTVSGLSSAVGRLEKTARNNSKLAGKMEKLKNTVLSRK